MYRFFVVARLGQLILLLILVLGIVTQNGQKMFDLGVASALLFLAFLDALISYFLPDLENQAPPKGTIRKLLALSPCSNTGVHATSAHKLIMATLSLLGMIWISSKVLHVNLF